MVEEPLKDAFWGSVQDSLVELHRMLPGEARTKVRDLRRRLECEPDPEFDGDIVYHSEPLHVANRLAERELDYHQVKARYQSILEHRFASAGALRRRRSSNG